MEKRWKKMKKPSLFKTSFEISNEIYYDSVQNNERNE